MPLEPPLGRPVLFKEDAEAALDFKEFADSRPCTLDKRIDAVSGEIKKLPYRRREDRFEPQTVSQVLEGLVALGSSPDGLDAIAQMLGKLFEHLEFLGFADPWHARGQKQCPGYLPGTIDGERNETDGAFTDIPDPGR